MLNRIRFFSIVLFLGLFFPSFVYCEKHEKHEKHEKQMESFDNLESAKSILQNLNYTPRAFSTFDFGREKDSANISILVPEGKAIPTLEQVRKSATGQLISFIGTTRWLGDEKHEGEVEIVIAKGTSQWDILRIARSDAINYDMQTEDLIPKLQSYDRMYGIDIYQAETDTIQFRLKTMPKDMIQFANDLYEFCPDIVDQGAGSLEALVDEINANQTVYLWWD